MVGEVSFTDSEEARDRGHKLVVHPDTTHRVVDSRIDHHRRLVGIVVGDLFVHLEEVTIASFYDILTKTLDSAGEVEEDSQPRVVDTVASVAAFLSSTAGDVTRHEVTEGGIAALEVVVTILLLDIGRTKRTSLELLSVFDILGYPDTAVITERLRHQRELRLEFAVDGDTRGVDLCHTGVSEVSTLLVALPSS